MGSTSLFAALFVLFLGNSHANSLRSLPSTMIPDIMTFDSSLNNVNRNNVCGRSRGQSRIVGGQDARSREWPWQVSIRMSDRDICGGVLIADKWVLSAAHCLRRARPEHISVVLGTLQLSGSNPHAVISKVKTIRQHPNYDFQSRSPGDLALVELQTPVNFTDYIMPVCLPDSPVHFPTGMVCWVTGWGYISSQEALPSPGILQKAKLPLIDAETCDELYHIKNDLLNENTSLVKEDKICAGYVEGGKDGCKGDSGGPLVCQQDGTWLLAGISSFGDGCALANRPGVYTRIPAYIDWIKQMVPEINSTTLNLKITATSLVHQNFGRVAKVSSDAHLPTVSLTLVTIASMLLRKLSDI
ncbi:serine protease 27-like [Lissotriton helveticus]